MHELLQDCLPDSVYVECTLVRLTPYGEATIAPAGGTRVLLRRGRAARPDLLKLRGTWLGLKAPTTRDQQTWRLEAGDELLLGTDGMFDQFAGHDGTEVTEILSDVPETRTLLDELQLHLRERLRRVPQKDDITMVLLRRREPAEQAALTAAAGDGADDVPV
jgi:serine phosphatase RsbU (regulator of sigma subunit)